MAANDAQVLVDAAIVACITEGLDINVAVSQAINKQLPSGGALDPNSPAA